MFNLNEKVKGICKECGKEYVRRREWQKYCSPSCRWANYEMKNPRKKTVAGNSVEV
mgnify:CR=1 FL=1